MADRTGNIAALNAWVCYFYETGGVITCKHFLIQIEKKTAGRYKHESTPIRNDDLCMHDIQ